MDANTFSLAVRVAFTFLAIGVIIGGLISQLVGNGKPIDGFPPENILLECLSSYRGDYLYDDLCQIVLFSFEKKNGGIVKKSYRIDSCMTNISFEAGKIYKISRVKAYSVNLGWDEYKVELIES